jgi:hypothetical protein
MLTHDKNSSQEKSNTIPMVVKIVGDILPLSRERINAHP